MPSDSITMADALKLSTSTLDTVLLSTLMVLFVSVCVPTSVATVLSIAMVMLLPLRVEVAPVPPKIPNASESKSIEPLALPSVMSKSSAVICVST